MSSSTKHLHAGPVTVTGERITLNEDAQFTGSVTFNGPAEIKGELDEDRKLGSEN